MWARRSRSDSRPGSVQPFEGERSRFGLDHTRRTRPEPVLPGPRVRERTTSEVLLWTSHFRWPRDLPRDGSPDDEGARKLYQADEERSRAASRGPDAARKQNVKRPIRADGASSGLNWLRSSYTRSPILVQRTKSLVMTAVEM